jgi:hypothetical protein
MVEMSGGDHAVDEVGLDEGAVDVAFAGVVEDMLPLARTKPAMPWGARWWMVGMPVRLTRSSCFAGAGRCRRNRADSH